MIINKDIMRDNNERSVLAAIINNGPIARNDLSKSLGLNKVTVSDIVGQFMERKFVKSLGEVRETKGGTGRKPELVQYNAEYGYVVNFSISGTEVEMLVTKMDGRVLESNMVSIENQPIAVILEKMSELIDRLPEFEVQNGLQAISIAIFGVVYEGEIVSSPFIDYEKIDLTKYFQNKYQVPVVVENEANLSAIFEEDYSKQELQNLVSFSIHEGVGAGIIINAHLYSGNYGQAGEIGRIILPTKSKGPVSKLPSFNSEWSQVALLKKAGELQGKTDYSLELLAQSYSLGVPAIKELIGDFCYYLAVVTSDLICTYDPQMIFFNSPLIDKIPEILKNVQMKLSFLPLVPPLVMSKDVHYATMLGGASMAIHKVLQMEGTRLIFHH